MLKVPKDAPSAVCTLFIKWEGIECPCCGSVLRIRPHNMGKSRVNNVNHSLNSLGSNHRRAKEAETAGFKGSH